MKRVVGLFANRLPPVLFNTVPVLITLGLVWRARIPDNELRRQRDSLRWTTRILDSFQQHFDGDLSHLFERLANRR